MEDRLDATYDFLTGLPISIRSEILCFVLVFAFDYYPSDRDLVAALDRYVKVEDLVGLRRVGATVRLIGAADLVIPRRERVSRRNVTELPAILATQDLPDEMRGVLEQSAMRNEFSSKHIAQALDEWRKLRATTLGEDALIAYEHRQLAAASPP